MEQRISGREIVLFITMFKLWDAYLDTDIHNVDGIEFRKFGNKHDGFDEISYTLYENGKYEIEIWINPESGKDGSWDLVQFGNIFEEVNV